MNKPKIKIWSHSNVNPDGMVDGGGAVGVEHGIKVFRGTPCGCTTCNHEHDFIVCSDGHDAEKRTVSGTTYFFNNTEDLNVWLENQAYQSIKTLIFP
jgi:hypothetical protein